MDTETLIKALRQPSAWQDPNTWDTLTDQAADRLETILKAWKHYRDTMTQSGGEDWVLEEAISGIKEN